MYTEKDFKRSTLAYDPHRGQYLVRTSSLLHPWISASGERFSDEEMKIQGFYPVFMNRPSPSRLLRKLGSWVTRTLSKVGSIVRKN